MRCHSSQRFFLRWTILTFLSIVDVRLGLPELEFTCSLRERDHVFNATYLEISLDQQTPSGNDCFVAVHSQRSTDAPCHNRNSPEYGATLKMSGKALSRRIPIVLEDPPASHCSSCLQQSSQSQRARYSRHRPLYPNSGPSPSLIQHAHRL